MKETAPLNPAFAAFLAALGQELTWAQVRIRRAGAGFELRAAADAAAAPEALRPRALPELRLLAQTTADQRYRPLRCAPNLASGWRCALANAAELQQALELLYPGTVADWYAARSAQPPITSYREITARQTGMYRVTAKLEDALAEQTIAKCCAPESCLKRRLWSVGTLPADAAGDKSLIPCLQPCAVLLDAARKAWRATHRFGTPEPEGES